MTNTIASKKFSPEEIGRFIGPFHEVPSAKAITGKRATTVPVHRYAVCDRWCGHLPDGFSASECNVCGGALDVTFPLDIDGIDCGIRMTSLICSKCIHAYDHPKEAK